MTKYKFGVGTKVWEMEADDMTNAYITMAMFIGKNIPVAVYEPQRYGFMPKDILEINFDTFIPEKVKQFTLSIKELKNDHL